MGFALTLDTLRCKSGTIDYRLAKWRGLSEAYIYGLERRQRAGTVATG